VSSTTASRPPGPTASADGIVLLPIRLRLADPPESDVMARVVALRLRAMGRLEQ
jgi:hypothetical protein